LPVFRSSGMSTNHIEGTELKLPPGTSYFFFFFFFYLLFWSLRTVVVPPWLGGGCKEGVLLLTVRTDDQGVLVAIPGRDLVPYHCNVCVTSTLMACLAWCFCPWILLPCLSVLCLLSDLPVSLTPSPKVASLICVILLHSVHGEVSASANLTCCTDSNSKQDTSLCPHHHWPALNQVSKQQHHPFLLMTMAPPPTRFVAPVCHRGGPKEATSLPLHTPCPKPEQDFPKPHILLLV
jgi:hypothetical protein